MISAAHRAGLPFRITELNSVTCGGRPHVSDAFATALWAPDTLFALLRAGADGVNLHVRANMINAPFAFTRHGLFARPLLYGLVMLSRSLAGASGLVASHLRAPGSLHLNAWVVRVRNGALRVLAVNKGRHTVRLWLALPGPRSATVEQLRARGPGARFGVTLAGQRIGPRGQWLGPERTGSVARSQHGYPVLVPRYSAALITIPAAPPNVSAPVSSQRPIS
jgi:hypothetical protein